MRSRALLLLLILALGCSAACAEILGLRPPGPRPFEHRAHVLQGISCTKCHGGVSTAGDEGPLHLPGTRDCTACHDKPHDDHDCSGCHGLPSTRRSAALAREELRFSHETHVPRVRGNCVRCHLDIQSGADVLRPRMATCGSCHEHQAQIASNCSQCHVDVRAEDNKPDEPEDHLIHGPNFLREHAARAAASPEVCSNCHQESFCAGCHGVTVPALPERLAFDDPTRAGVHRAGFMARHAEEARTDPGLCTTCHAPSACSSCHDRERVSQAGGGASPHPAGWLGLPGQRNDHGRAAWRDPDTCAGCHGGGELCVGCHKVGGIGGNPHAPGWVSRKQPTTDRPCRLCHGSGL